MRARPIRYNMSKNGALYHARVAQSATRNTVSGGRQAKPAPYLDTIETTEFSKSSKKASNINVSAASDCKKLYSDFSSFNCPNNSDTIKSLEYYKSQSMELAGLLQYYDSILQDRADKMMMCGTYLELGQGGKVCGANFCRQRICPACQRRRSLKVAADIANIQSVLSDYEWLHVVLTVPNCNGEQLTDTVDRLYRCSSELFRDKRIKQGFKGVLRCLEITYNPKGDYSTAEDSGGLPRYLSAAYYHPHLHCLCAVKKSYFTSRYYINSSLLRWKWCYYWGATELLQVHMTKVKDSAAVNEVAKYCVKPLDLDLPSYERVKVTEHMFACLHGRRLLQTYGIVREAARQCKIDFNADEEFSNSDIIVHRFSYDFIKRRYYYNSTETL